MDIQQILVTALLKFPDSASAVLVLTTLGYVLVHLFPLLPLPAPEATGFYPKLHRVLSWLAGNWGNAKPGPVAVTTDGAIVPIQTQGHMINVPLVAASPDVVKVVALPILAPGKILAVLVVVLGSTLSLAACVTPANVTTVGTPSTQALQALNTVQAAYIVAAKLETQLITTGVVKGQGATDLKAADQLLYSTIVAFRTSVEKGDKITAIAVKAMQAALQDLTDKLATWTSIPPDQKTVLQGSLVLLAAYLATLA